METPKNFNDVLNVEQKLQNSIILIIIVSILLANIVHYIQSF